MMPLLVGLAILTLCAGVVLGRRLRRRGFDKWIGPYVLQTFKRRLPRDDEEVHVILCFADHFEPKGGKASPERAQARLDRWLGEYPRQFGAFRDSDGRCPRHTFFYPIEEYDAAHVDALTQLCQAGFGEVEMHLHHDGDTAATLHKRLLEFKDILARRHGLLARHRVTGELAYGFVHGNWTLCNSLPGGRWCGVNEELDVLRQTGCYADFTMPSAPHVTQARKINSIYYAVQRVGQPRSSMMPASTWVPDRGPLAACCSCRGLWSMTGAGPRRACFLVLRMAACRTVSPRR